MSTARKTFIAGLVLFLGFVIYHGLSSYAWSAQTNPPSGVAPQTVTYTCGAPLGSGFVHGPARTAYPLTGRPCGERTQYQFMTVADVILGALALGVVLTWRRDRPVPA